MKLPVLSTIALLGAALLVSACLPEDEKAAASQSRPAPEVTVAAPLKKEVVDWDQYTGRFEAVERVEIRARVSGYLSKILFQDGDIVEKGETLFVIDQRPFRIAVDRAQAQYDLAQKEFARSNKLRQSSAASEANLDRRRQELKVAKADLDRAQLDLEFTEIKAPTSGRIGRSNVDIGNLISGDLQNGTPLTTIVSTDPIHFYFEASEQQFLKYSRLNESGARPGSRDVANPVFVKLQDEDKFTHEGRMDFVDNEIDRGTGTIVGRALLSNESGLLAPGMFGLARLVGSGPYEAFLIPDTAIGTDQARKFVMVVNGEGKAERRFVKLGPLRDSGLRIIKEGLSENDQVIINGLQRARPGTPVKTKDGVIEEAASAPPGGIDDALPASQTDKSQKG